MAWPAEHKIRQRRRRNSNIGRAKVGRWITAEGMKLGHGDGNKNKSVGSEFCRRQWTNGWRQTRSGTHKVRKTESETAGEFGGKERREEAAISHLARHSGLIG